LVRAGRITASQTSSFRSPRAAASDPFSYWTVSPAENLTIAVPLRKADGIAIESKTVLRIVHTLFGYEFSILIQFTKTVATFLLRGMPSLATSFTPLPTRSTGPRGSAASRRAVTSASCVATPPPRLAASNRSAGGVSEA
jgi:hypothetical protein